MGLTMAQRQAVTRRSRSGMGGVQDRENGDLVVRDDGLAS